MFSESQVLSDSIIGDGDRPYTIAEVSESLGTGNDSQLREVTVNYSSPKPIAMEA